MKTKARTHARKSNMSQYKDGFRIGFILILLVAMALVSCSDDEKAATPDTRQQFVGTYSVEDISQSSGYVYNYDVTVTTGEGNYIRFSNFADMFNIPIKATVSGNSFDIPAQSFTNPSGKSIKVYGSGTFQNGKLTFSYTTEGYLDYTGACTAVKNN